MELYPKQVLWPTDFSELSMKGGRYARAFVDAFQAELRVIHICQPLIGSSSDLPLTPGLTAVGRLNATAATTPGTGNGFFVLSVGKP